MKLRLIFSCCLVAIAAAMTGCGMTGGHNLPPASRLMEPGPGVGGPGPGVLNMPAPGVQQASFSAPVVSGGIAGGAPGGGASASSEVQVLFARPEAMQVTFDAGGSYSSAPIVTPGRQNFMQGGVYRLKVTGIPGREGTELYPTLEIGPPTRPTAAYLAHNAIPVQFTEEDFDQVLSGNFVTKVIYLPSPDFQDFALAGVETLVSMRLDPGYDPIVEADRRGSILAVVRIGNKDMEVPGGSSVTPMYGATAGATGVLPASYAAPAGGPVAIPAGSGVQQASFGCDSCGCADGSCGTGGPCFGAGIGGCLGGACGTAADFYGPNSTPRGGHGPGGLPPGLAGAGQWGMPITGTPIGLPGPAHVPLGVPAGLKKHVMKNWTHRKIPDPVSKLKINVKQRPGLSYPQPPSRAWVREDTIHSAPHYSNRHFGIPPGGMQAGGAIQAAGFGGGACPDGSCPPAGGSGLLGGLLGH